MSENRSNFQNYIHHADALASYILITWRRAALSLGFLLLHL